MKIDLSIIENLSDWQLYVLYKDTYWYRSVKNKEDAYKLSVVKWKLVDRLYKNRNILKDGYRDINYVIIMDKRCGFCRLFFMSCWLTRSEDIKGDICYLGEECYEIMNGYKSDREKIDYALKVLEERKNEFIDES